jgi:arylsulfatase
LPAGKAQITISFVAQGDLGPTDPVPGQRIGPGIGYLSVNGTPAGEARFARFGAFNSETFDIGNDLGSPVSDDYATPFVFTGKVDKVTLELR